MIYSPEPPIEPDEPEEWGICILCDGAIYKGERFFSAQNGRVCHFCAERLPFSDEIAGEYD